MTCPHTQHVHAYHDGELSPDAARMFEQHMAACDACREELSALRRISSMLQLAHRPLPGVDVMHRWSRGMRQVDERRVLRLAGAMSAAAAAVLVTASLSLFMGQAQASPTISEWELAALNPSTDEPAPRSMLVARWIVADLTTDGDQAPRSNPQ